MPRLYDDDEQKIRAILEPVVQKWGRKSNSAENLQLFHQEVIGRLRDGGYEAQVDVTPTLAGKPPVVSIVGRVDLLDEGVEFDVERHRYDIRKSREQGGR